MKWHMDLWNLNPVGLFVLPFDTYISILVNLNARIKRISRNKNTKKIPNVVSQFIYAIAFYGP